LSLGLGQGKLDPGVVNHHSINLKPLNSTMDPQSHLLDVLNSHNSNLGLDDISWVFEQPKTAVAVTAYINRNLTPATLLTLEEEAVYNHLTRCGAIKPLIPHISPSSPVLSDDTLLRQTATLFEHTRQLREHSATLIKQRETIAVMRSRRRAEHDRRRKSEAARIRKWASERDEISAAVDDLIGILKEEVADLRETLTDQVRDADQIQAVLESDDRVLARLERLSEGLVVPEDDDDSGAEVARVQGLVEKLAVMEGAAIRSKLDRVFLENSTGVGEETETGQEELDGLRAGIDSLYGDIPVVAQGAARAQFLTPLIASITTARMRRGDNWAIGGDYIITVLSHLRARNDAIASLLTSSHDRDSAVLSLISTIDRESISPLQPALFSVPSKPSTPRSSTTSVTSPGAAAGVGDTKPGRIPFLSPVPTTPRRRGKSVDLLNSHTRDQYPELALLAHLGITPPLPPAPANPPSPHIISNRFLVAQIATATERLGRVAVAATEVDTNTDEAQGVVQVLQKALVCGRGEGGVGAEDVERGVKEVASVMGRLVWGVEELERTGGDVGDLKRKASFVHRWGR
jgi:hypothetical protein